MLIKLSLTHPEIFSDGTTIFLLQCRTQSIDAVFDETGLLVIADILTARLETSALAEMKQGAAELVRLQSLVERAGAEFVWIKRFQRFASSCIGWHQPEPDQSIHKAFAASQVAISAATHLARDATVGGK